MEFTVLKAGGWGTAIAGLLAQKGHSVHLWAEDKDLAAVLKKKRENTKYLPGVKLPGKNLEIFTDLEEITGQGQVFLIVVPSFVVRKICKRVADILSPSAQQKSTFINLAKGLERGSFLTMSEVIDQELDLGRVYTLSGPSHAEEVGREIPTTVVLAGKDLEHGKIMQEAFMTERFRVYLSRDIKGVEYAGAVKNVIALACGISDGLGYGDNSKGALISRGLAELTRLAEVLEVKKETFFGLSGLGDLVTTCISEHSRNRYVGYQIGKGKSAEEVLANMDKVAEGVYGCQVLHEMASLKNIELPITEAVYEIIYEGGNPSSKVDELMLREPKQERL